jgi:hypothetical protein
VNQKPGTGNRAPTRVPLSSLTRERLGVLFAPADRPAAEALLVGECGTGLPCCERCTAADLERIRFACLKLSGGRLDQLRYWVDEAKKDWRDVLMAAGFGYTVTAHLAWRPGL